MLIALVDIRTPAPALKGGGAHPPLVALALRVEAVAHGALERALLRVRGGAHTRNQITFWPLTGDGPAGGLHAYKIRISARRRTPPAELPVHEGHDWMYVLSGRLRLLLGERDFTIEPGEAVEFSTWTPHWFGAVDGPVEAIALLGLHGERVHLHTDHK